MRVWVLSSLPSWKKTPEAGSSGQLVECLPPASAPVLCLLGLVALTVSQLHIQLVLHTCHVSRVSLQHPGPLCPSLLWVLHECLPLPVQDQSPAASPPTSVLCWLLLLTSSSCWRAQAAHLFFICTQSSPCILLGPSVCGDPQICVTRPDLWMPCFSMADLMPP